MYGKATIRKRPHPNVAPVTVAQEGFWLLNQLEPTDTSYNVPVLLRLEGSLDRGRLRDAFCQMIRRHESLRTTFRLINGFVHQYIHHENGFDPVREVDFTHVPAEQQANQTQQELRTIFHEPFSLHDGPLFRVLVI